MSKYITTSFFREHSRINSDDASEEYLEHTISAAEGLLARDLQRDSLEEVEQDGELPEPLKRAILMLAGAMYENRESESPVDLKPDPLYWHLIVSWIKYRG